MFYGVSLLGNPQSQNVTVLPSFRHELVTDYLANYAVYKV